MGSYLAVVFMNKVAQCPLTMRRAGGRRGGEGCTACSAAVHTYSGSGTSPRQTRSLHQQRSWGLKQKCSACHAWAGSAGADCVALCNMRRRRASNTESVSRSKLTSAMWFSQNMIGIFRALSFYSHRSIAVFGARFPPRSGSLELLYWFINYAICDIKTPSGHPWQH